MKLATLCYIRKGGSTLMIHRIKKQNDMHAGKWNGLGGKLEPGESPEECAIREIHEELGVTITPVRRVWRNVTPWNVKLAWWLGRIDNGQSVAPNPTEVAAAHWVSVEEIREMPNLLESMPQFLDALESGEIDLDREHP